MTQQVKHIHRHADRLFRRQRSRCYRSASQDALLKRQVNKQRILCQKISLKQGNRISLHPRCALPSPPSRPTHLQRTRLTVHCQLGTKLLKIAPSFWDFVTLPEEDRAMAIGNMHRKIGKARACGSGDILADRQTETDVLTTILLQRSRGRNNK